MPLVEHSSLPTFRTLRDQGLTVLSMEEARHQDMPGLRIGLLNMMPDEAFQVTEQQFIRLVGGSAHAAHFYVHAFTVEGLRRSELTDAYIAQHYEDIPSIYAAGLDALIMTGTNVANPDLSREPFYGPMTEVIDWAGRNATPVLCSCLATHAVLRFLYRIVRTRLPRKRWGVYSHQMVAPEHPLLQGLALRFDVPHSRYNDISREQFQEAGLNILIESAEAGVHAAAGADDFRHVYLQGHPEYDVNSLLKEYKREVRRHFNGERDRPVFPEHYLPDEAVSRINGYLEEARAAHDAGALLPEFPEAEVVPFLDNTWEAAGQTLIHNWLGLLLQRTTNPEFTSRRQHQ